MQYDQVNAYLQDCKSKTSCMQLINTAGPGSCPLTPLIMEASDGQLIFSCSGSPTYDSDMANAVAKKPNLALEMMQLMRCLQRHYEPVNVCQPLERYTHIEGGRTIIEALSAHFGEVPVCTNQHFGMHWWLISVKMQCHPILTFFIVPHLHSHGTGFTVS